MSVCNCFVVVEGRGLMKRAWHDRGLKLAAVKAPGFGDNRKANLQDIAVLAGGTVRT